MKYFGYKLDDFYIQSFYDNIVQLYKWYLLENKDGDSSLAIASGTYVRKDSATRLADAANFLERQASNSLQNLTINLEDFKTVKVVGWILQAASIVANNDLANDEVVGLYNGYSGAEGYFMSQNFMSIYDLKFEIVLKTFSMCNGEVDLTTMVKGLYSMEMENLKNKRVFAGYEYVTEPSLESRRRVVETKQVRRIVPEIKKNQPKKYRPQVENKPEPKPETPRNSKPTAEKLARIQAIEDRRKQIEAERRRKLIEAQREAAEKRRQMIEAQREAEENRRRIIEAQRVQSDVSENKEEKQPKRYRPKTETKPEPQPEAPRNYRPRVESSSNSESERRYRPRVDSKPVINTQPPKRYRPRVETPPGISKPVIKVESPKPNQRRVETTRYRSHESVKRYRPTNPPTTQAPATTTQAPTTQPTRRRYTPRTRSNSVSYDRNTHRNIIQNMRKVQVKRTRMTRARWERIKARQDRLRRLREQRG